MSLASSGFVPDEVQTLVDGQAEALHGLGILLCPVAARQPGADQHVGIDLGEIFGRDIPDFGRDDAGAQRIDDADEIELPLFSMSGSCGSGASTIFTLSTGTCC